MITPDTIYMEMTIIPLQCARSGIMNKPFMQHKSVSYFFQASLYLRSRIPAHKKIKTHVTKAIFKTVRIY